jgi:hypothetical protein
MLIIGLGYKARQGKNDVAKYMKEYACPEVGIKMSFDGKEVVCTKIPDRVKIYAFADELKLYCREHHNELVSQWQLAHQTKRYPSKKEDPIYGYASILQWYGTDVVRKATPNYWVETLAKRIEADEPEVAIVTDVRYPNEAEYIKKAGGFMVEVVRLDERGNQYQDPGRDLKHISETALDGYEFDFVITAKSGDLAMLRKKSIGVYNLVTNPQAYHDNLEDVPIYLPKLDDPFFFTHGLGYVDEPDEFATLITDDHDLNY